MQGSPPPFSGIKLFFLRKIGVDKREGMDQKREGMDQKRQQKMA